LGLVLPTSSLAPLFWCYWMRIIVTGASSQPGYKLVLLALERGYQVYGFYLTHEIPYGHRNLKKIKLDITDHGRVWEIFHKISPDAIFHIAAYGDVDGCEINRQYAWRVNYLASENIAKISAKLDAFLVYLSTDYVFDGSRGNYKETDPTYPINFYGLTKLLGEVASLSANDRVAIVRASAIYGLGPGRKNFARFLIENLSSGKEVRAFIDQFLSPTNSTLLAEAILEIYEKGLTGVFHIVGERLSRYDFAIRVATALGLDRNLIKKGSMDDVLWKAKRPRDSSLNCENTKKRLKVDFYSMNLAMSILREEYEKYYG